MNEYRLIITDSATNDLDSIYSYIKEELLNDTASIQLVTEIENSILRLKSFPESCSYVNDDRLKKQGYRKLLVKNYIVLYTIDSLNNIVTITRIMYSKQNYIDIL